MKPVEGNADRTVHGYYRTIDDGAYDELSGLLDPAFVQYRPDRTIDGREAFVRFMREERPRTDTTHELRGLFRRTDGDDEDPLSIAARGTLTAEDGEHLFAFVDVHAVGNDGRIETLWTYVR